MVELAFQYLLWRFDWIEAMKFSNLPNSKQLYCSLLTKAGSWSSWTFEDVGFKS